jgi:hypothetical protein
VLAIWAFQIAVSNLWFRFELCEEAVLSRAETLLQGTTQDTLRAEFGYGERVSRRLWFHACTSSEPPKTCTSDN